MHEISTAFSIIFLPKMHRTSTVIEIYECFYFIFLTLIFSSFNRLLNKPSLFVSSLEPQNDIDTKQMLEDLPILQNLTQSGITGKTLQGVDL